MNIIATAVLVLGLAATAATPSFAAARHHAPAARQYESLVQRDAGPVAFEQVQQPRTINVWGSRFTVN